MTTSPSDYEIAITIGDSRWDVLPNIQTMSERAVNAATQHILAKPFAELSLAYIDDEHMKNLNNTYRGKNKPTNVLSFSSVGGGAFTPLLGDIVFAFETVRAEAQKFDITLEDHLAHLNIHGFYHLQGYDHQNEKDAHIMEGLEMSALADLGISNPYAREKHSA